jgi:hypothetical protein
MLRVVASTDLSTLEGLQTASELLDLDNLTDYWLFNIYAANLDWPHHNVFSFRRRTGSDRRWRWISWDADATFNFLGQGLRHNTLAWATRDRLRHELRFNNEKGLLDAEHNLISTIIVRKLLQNPQFRSSFLARAEQLLENQLRPEAVERHLSRLIDGVSHDLPADWRRWSIEEADYWRNVAQIREFIRQRPILLKQHLHQQYSVGFDTQ